MATHELRPNTSLSTKSITPPITIITTLITHPTVTPHISIQAISTRFMSKKYKIAERIPKDKRKPPIEARIRLDFIIFKTLVYLIFYVCSGHN